MSVTDRDLKDAHAILAEVVEACGEKFLPLFDNIDREVLRRKQLKSRLDGVGAIDPATRRSALRRRARTNRPGRGGRSS